jgi:hypothetical protein
MSQTFATRFRNLACDFRALAKLPRYPRESAEAVLVFRRKYRHLQLAGRLVLDAHEAGELRLPGLAELIEKIMGDRQSVDTSKAPEASLVSCPANVFLEVAGGNALEVYNTGQGIVSIPLLSGGLLPDSGRLPEGELQDLERWALACDALAGLVDARMKPTPERLAAGEEWSIPTTLGKLASRLNMGEAKAKTFLKRYHLEIVDGNRQSWHLRLDLMDPNLRDKIEGKLQLPQTGRN